MPLNFKILLYFDYFKLVQKKWLVLIIAFSFIGCYIVKGEFYLEESVEVITSNIGYERDLFLNDENEGRLDLLLDGHG